MRPTRDCCEVGGGFGCGASALLESVLQTDLRWVCALGLQRAGSLLTTKLERGLALFESVLECMEAVLDAPESANATEWPSFCRSAKNLQLRCAHSLKLAAAYALCLSAGEPTKFPSERASDNRASC